MAKQLTQDEILEQQRQENTKAYAAKVHSLQLQANDLENKVSNLKKTLDDAFARKIQDLRELEDELGRRIAYVDNVQAEIAAVKRECLIKKQQADEFLEKTKADMESHFSNVENHFNSVEETKNDLSKRISDCIDKENKAEDLIKEANLRILEAEKKEKECQEKIKQLNSLSENLKQDVENHKIIEAKNKLEIDNIAKQKEEVLSIKAKNDEDYKAVIVTRNELDAARESLAKRKLELDQKEEGLKQKNIKYALDAQRLQDKEKEVSSQIGKLNELKNNVESLMKLQENKGA